MIKSLNKALDIIEHIYSSNNNLSVSDISVNLNINRTTAHRILKTLESRGYLLKTITDNRYNIGLKFLPLAAKFLDSNKLRIESLPYIKALAQKCGERVNIGIINGREIVYIGGVEKPSLPDVYTRFGKTAPIHCCSLGKILLAFMPDEDIEYLLSSSPLKKYTKHSITDPIKLKEHLSEIRAEGTAIDNKEHLPDTCCIAALIRNSQGNGIGAISMSAEDLTKLKKYTTDLVKTAEVISHLMGYKS
jgi:DNA-binding IclR family transcriptional regulator